MGGIAEPLDAALAHRLLPDFSVLGCPNCWRTSVYVPHLASFRQRGHCRRMPRVWFLISVKRVETLPGGRVWFVCGSEHIGVFPPCSPVFSPPSVLPPRTNVRDSLPPPPGLPGPLQGAATLGGPPLTSDHHVLAQHPPLAWKVLPCLRMSLRERVPRGGERGQQPDQAEEHRVRTPETLIHRKETPKRSDDCSQQ